MSLKTSLYSLHIKHGAKLVDYHGWEMPLHYGSQIEEHRFVREKAGIFDVSHMSVIDLSGENSHSFLRKLLANDIAKLSEVEVPYGRAQYSCMLNESGGVIDDLIVYPSSQLIRLVVNAGCKEKDFSWISKQAEPVDVVATQRNDLSILAVQGKQARETCSKVIQSGKYEHQIMELKRFHTLSLDTYFIARTGYTGEDGFEIILPNRKAPELFEQLVEAGIQPIGLGARDTLRLEAGYNLYGQDMNEALSPLESGLAWTVSLDNERDFIGKEALLKQKSAGISTLFTGVKLEGKGILRSQTPVFSNEKEVGKVTSGSFSPSCDCSIGLARVQAPVSAELYVMIRNKKIKLTPVAYPFIKEGKPTFNTSTNP